MRQSFAPHKLNESYFSPHPTHTLDVTTLNGGLNLWDLDYRMKVNQSPDCVNVYWKDGSLASRPGQEYVFEQLEPDPEAETPVVDYGVFCACFRRLWHEKIIAQKGTRIYAIDPEDGTHTDIFDPYDSLTQRAGGTFFVFGDKLYYMNGVDYVVVTASTVGTSVVLSAARVQGYVPVVVINRQPSGSGGDLYQPENRIAAGKEVWFTADGTSTIYVLPYQNLDQTGLIVKVTDPTTFVETTYTEVESNPGATEYTVDRTAGTITFGAAPAQSQLQVANNVKVTCFKSDLATANSVLRCSCVTVYGGDVNLSVVCGGTPAQPNAYFWSGNNGVNLDPTYFPFDYYNFAGSDAQNYVTGFGRQQNKLIIFQERSIGKTTFSIETISDLDYLKLAYTPVNDEIGCDIEGSIRLIENNLVFANTYGGVYVLMDTTAAEENNVKRISRNVNGDGENRGLLKDLRAVSAPGVTSLDDGQRYWLAANGVVYVWDYQIKGYRGDEENLTWFYFDNIASLGWVKNVDDVYYFKQNGSLVEFTDGFADFGEGITRRYAFAAQSFGSYEPLKDVLEVVFAVRSDTDSRVNIKYKSDYEERLIIH